MMIKHREKNIFVNSKRKGTPSKNSMNSMNIHVIKERAEDESDEDIKKFKNSHRSK
jgi:hypothetical protein